MKFFMFFSPIRRYLRYLGKHCSGAQANFQCRIFPKSCRDQKVRCSKLQPLPKEMPLFNTKSSRNSYGFPLISLSLTNLLHWGPVNFWDVVDLMNSQDGHVRLKFALMQSKNFTVSCSSPQTLQCLDS